METKVCPCKGCVAPKRHAACHSHCQEYIDWDTERQQELAKIREARNIEWDYDYVSTKPCIRKKHIGRRPK